MARILGIRSVHNATVVTPTHTTVMLDIPPYTIMLEILTHKTMLYTPTYITMMLDIP